jgi:hypothetical protein
MKIFDIFKKEQKFSIGDIVICIDDRPFGNSIPPPLIYKKKYKILDIFITSCCKEMGFDVGLNNTYSYTKCYCHIEMKFPGKGIHWASSKRFRKATPEEAKVYYQEQEQEIKDKIQQAVEEENFEEAQKLQELLQ